MGAGCKVHCVRLVLTHQLICNIIYLGHSLGLIIWPDLRSIIQNDLLEKKYICFVASQREECDDARWVLDGAMVRWCYDGAFFSTILR